MKQGLSLLLFFCLLLLKGFSQGTLNIPNQVVEQYPYFQGCENENIDDAYRCSDTKLMKILQKTPYPKEAAENDYSGTVLVKLTVDENGKVTNVMVEKSSGYAILDNAFMEQIIKLPPFVPAQKDGKNVSYNMILPMSFSTK